MSHTIRSLVTTALAALFVLAAGAVRAAHADCPALVVFEPTGTSEADVGWTGLEHDLSYLGATLPLTVACGTSTPPCGTCDVNGILPGVQFRCRDDFSRTCTVATEVADCGGAGRCHVPLGPPQSIAIGGIQLCLTMDVAGAVGGTVNVESGAFAPSVPIHVRLGSQANTNQGCPRCIGDGTANDGSRDGTCDAGLRQGAACDANADTIYSDFGSSSFDCPPFVAPVFSGDFDIGTIPATTGTITRTLTSDSPICIGAPGNRCFCSTCNNLSAEPCFADADCPPSGGSPGVCGGRRCVGGTNFGAPCTNTSECPSGVCNRPGEPPKPDACLDDTTTPNDCVAIGDGDGECTIGPLDNYCQNHPNRGCITDSDCDGGTCATRGRPCFPDNAILGASFSMSGTATPPVSGISDPTDLVVLTCMGATGSSSWNNVGGFPGLLRTKQSGRLSFVGGPLPTPEPTATPDPAPTATGPTPIATVTPVPFVCPVAPAPCRGTIQSGSSRLQITDRSVDEKDRLEWKWRKGEATSLGDFGAPSTSHSYALCIYDGSSLRQAFDIPADGMCAGKPCWKAKTNGFSYRDKDATPNGITSVTLKAGAAGRAQVQVKGAGPLLALPPLPTFTGTTTVQLRNRTTAVCFGSTFSPPFTKRTDEQLKAKGD